MKIRVLTAVNERVVDEESNLNRGCDFGVKENTHSVHIVLCAQSFVPLRDSWS